jgi:hypothetical protein
MRHLTVTDSDVIEAVGYERSTVGHASAAISGGVLEVVFKSSPTDVYRYAGVKPDTFATLVSADSIGKTFHELFRKTKYPFTKSERKLTLKK